MDRILRYFKTSAAESQVLISKKTTLIRVLYQQNKNRQSKQEVVEYVSRLSEVELCKLFDKYSIK